MQRKVCWLDSLVNSNLYAYYSITMEFDEPLAHLKGNYNANGRIFCFWPNWWKMREEKREEEKKTENNPLIHT